MLFLRWYLWVAPSLISLFCVLILLRRKLYETFPAFVAYLSLQVLEFFVLLAVDLLIVASRSSLLTFRWTSVIFEVIEAVAQLLVLYELARYLLSSRPSSAKALRTTSRVMLAALLLIAAACAALLPQKGLERAMAAFQVLDFSISLIAVGLLIALLLCTRVLRISWRSLPAGIALGFGIITSAELISSPLFPAVSGHNFIPTDLFRMGADHVAVIMWLVYILLPERLPRYTGTPISKVDFDGWQQQLEGVIRK